MQRLILKRPLGRSGYTLIEVMIVVMILGILATLVMPAVADFEEQATQTAFTSDVLTYASAANLYRLETGDYLEDSGSGEFPDGFEDYVNRDQWTDGTPIGGVWDFERNSFGVASAFGVHFHRPKINGAIQDDAYMQAIDQRIDDGSLRTGRFRKIDVDRYYFILQE